MKYCRSFSRADPRQQPAGLLGRDSNDLHASSLCLSVQLRHDGKLAIGAGTHDQPMGRPRDLLGGGQRRVTVSITVGLRRLLLATAHVAGLEDDVAVEAASLDLEHSEADELGLHLTRLTQHAMGRRELAASRPSCPMSARSSSQQDMRGHLQAFRFAGRRVGESCRRSEIALRTPKVQRGRRSVMLSSSNGSPRERRCQSMRALRTRYRSTICLSTLR